jgi:hypothetical protein
MRLPRSLALAAAAAGLLAAAPGTGNALPQENVHISLSVTSTYGATASATAFGTGGVANGEQFHMTLVRVGTSPDARTTIPDGTSNCGPISLAGTAGASGPAVFVAYAVGHGRDTTCHSAIDPDLVLDGFASAAVCTAPGACVYSPTTSIPDIQAWLGARGVALA